MNTGLSGAIQPLRPDGFYFCSRHGRTTYLSDNWHSNTQPVRLFNMSDKYVCGLNSTFFAIPECSALLKMPQSQMTRKKFNNTNNVLRLCRIVATNAPAAPGHPSAAPATIRIVQPGPINTLICNVWQHLRLKRTAVGKRCKSPLVNTTPDQASTISV